MNKNFKNHSNKPNGNKNKGGSSNQRGNLGSKQQSENNGAKNDECFNAMGKVTMLKNVLRNSINLKR